MAGFVPYIHLNDYLPTIQSGQLNYQILDALEAGNKQRIFAESWAIGKIRGKLKDTFDLNAELTPTLPYDNEKQYYAGDRVIIDYDAWVAGTSYTAFKNCVIKDAIGYMCIVDTASTSFEQSEWVFLGKQFDIYYIPYPFPLFSLTLEEDNGAVQKGMYYVGDKVWWANHTYTCLRDSLIIDQLTALNYPNYKSIPFPNVFPNNTRNGKDQWKDEGEYLITIGDYPALSTAAFPNTTWILGDNRDPLFVQAIIDIALFRLHDRISPNNIPQLRTDNYWATMKWLEDVSDGKDSTDINYKQPPQGVSIAWGSSIKNQNGY
jgi:hypothetical protein